MKNAMSVLAVLLLTACGGGDGDAESFEQRSERMARALCTYQQKCKGQSGYDSCYRDVVTDMGDAKEMLGTDGQTACMRCMGVKIEELEKANNSACNESPNQQRVINACGASGDEACAGYP